MKALELFRMVVKEHQERGWGRGLRSAVAAWYANRPVAEVASDILKCPEHEGWTHRDLLRLAHPKPGTRAQNALYQWAANGHLGHLATPDLVAGELRQVHAVERLRTTVDEYEARHLVEQYALTPGMVPAEWRKSAAVWEALLPGMSCADIVEHLPALYACGLLAEESAATALVVARLIDRRRVASSGLNPEDVERARDRCARLGGAVVPVLDAALCELASLVATCASAPS